ncbi:unnamed protein product [Effrenium voratum]|nr:unnamed protein product [Effrenium voratum]
MLFPLVALLSLCDAALLRANSPQPVVVRLRRDHLQHHRHGITMSASSGLGARGTVCSPRQMRQLEQHQARLRHPALLQRSATSAFGESEVGVLRLQDLSSSEYAGLLGVGTRANCTGLGTRSIEGRCPAAQLRVIYDTGSADLWVNSDLCTYGPCSMDDRHRFNRSSSKTYEQANKPEGFQTEYASGSITGVLGTDDVWLGPVVVKQQTLGLISQEYGEAFTWMPIDGIVGLGFRDLAVKTRPLLDTLEEQALPHPEFAFFLHPDFTKGGALLWGKTEHLRLHQGPMRWFPVAEEKFWSISLLGFRLGLHSVQDLLPLLLPYVKRPSDGPLSQLPEDSPSRRPPDALAVLDSGTTFFTAPPRLFNEISRAVGPRSCDSIAGFPEFVFTVGTNLSNRSQTYDLVVPPQMYMTRDYGTERCVPGVMSMGQGYQEKPFMILGEVFMRHYFSIYQRGSEGSSRVGLAPARLGAAAERILQ